MVLDEGQQSAALAKMSPEAKTALLAGIKTRGSRSEKTSTGVSVPRGMVAQDTSIATGARKRLGGTLKGFYELGKDIYTKGPVETGAELAEGTKQTEREAFGQAKEQFKSGQTARGVVTGLSMLDPLATGSVVDINRLEDAGKHREAIGTGAFDILALWSGSETLKGPFGAAAPQTGKRIAKMTSAIGETGETVKNIERILPDLDETARTTGKPGTIGDLKGLVQGTLSGKEAEFQHDLAPIARQQTRVPQLANRLNQLLKPHLIHTQEGANYIKAVNRYIREYDHEWSYEEMNLERSRLRKQIRSFYSKSGSAQSAAKLTDADVAAQKVISDVFAETVNEKLGQLNPHKGRFYYDVLRQKQEALIDLKDHLDSQIENLRDAQAAKEGRTVGEKLKPHTYVSGAGPRVHMPLGEAIPREGPSDVADVKVRQAFGPTTGAKGTKAAVLGLPISHLATAGNKAKKSRMNPPPQLDE